MSINELYLEAAKESARIANEGYDNNPIDYKILYSQWSHETNGFTSDLCEEYNNLGGVTQTSVNNTPQPDGQYYYMQFESVEEYAEYFGRYLRLYEENGIYDASSIEDYAGALKDGGYFGDTLENYVAGMTAAYNDAFLNSCEQSEQTNDKEQSDVSEDNYEELNSSQDE